MCMKMPRHHLKGLSRRSHPVMLHGRVCHLLASPRHPPMYVRMSSGSSLHVHSPKEKDCPAVPCGPSTRCLWATCLCLLSTEGVRGPGWMGCVHAVSCCVKQRRCPLTTEEKGVE